MCIRDSDKADHYRNPVMIVADGMLGQMMEPVEFRDDLPTMTLPEKDWATTGTEGRRAPRIINSLFLKPEAVSYTHLDVYKRQRLPLP